MTGLLCAPPQALFGAVDDDAKLAGAVKAAKPVLSAAGGEPALQLAQLVALEYLLGVAAPARAKEVLPFAFLASAYYNRPENIAERSGPHPDYARSL